MDKAVRQKEIADWFDRTYQKRGSSYLRPVKAYMIFPELLQAGPEMKLLDVACGLGHLLSACQPYHCELFGLDISEVAIRSARMALPEATLVVGNAEEMPFEDQYFDLLTCLGSLERIIQLEKALSEIHRVVKDQGRICFLVRNSRSWKWQVKKKLGIQNHKGHQGAKELEHWTELFNQAGFKVLQTLPDQYPLQRMKALIRLGGGDHLFKEVQQGMLPLHWANEFLFVLKKSPHAS